jgi:hypothetical protein
MQDAPETVTKAAKPEVKPDDAFMATMRKRHERAIDRERTNREKAREDLNFKVGNQWPTAIVAEREANNRPILTFNKMLGFVRQVTGDVRQNKPAIRVRPVGEGSDKQTAEIFSGLIRNIENQSFAQYIYAVGADNATSCGQGAWRIVTDYTDDDAFLQDIRLKPIQNALSVVWDPDSVELDKSDARFCFVYSTLPTEEFKATYPEASEQPFDKIDNVTDYYGDWYTEDTVRIAEYWVKVPVTKTIAQLNDGRVICLDDYADEQKLAEKIGGAAIVTQRKVKTHKVMMHTVSGAEELEEPAEWAGKHIPIIHVMGEETWVDEKRVTYGLIRYAKDAQRAYNYARSTSIEVTGLQPKAQWLLSTAMIEGYETYWQNSGNTNYPYLPYHADPNLPSQTPRREHPPQPAAGLIAEAQLASDDMKATTGIYDASLGSKSNETSGVAITARKQEGDVSTFVYIDNLALAIAYTGRQLIDLIPKIYDTKRILRVLHDDGTDEEIVVNQSIMDGQGNSRTLHRPEGKFYDLTLGKYDVTVEAGPSFSSRRQEASTGIVELMKVMPQAAPLLGTRLAQLQDWPKATEIAEELERLLPPEMKKPEIGPDGQPVQPPPPPPPPELVKAQAEIEAAQQKAQFEQQKAMAELEQRRMIAEQEMQLAQQQAVANFTLKKQQAQAEMELEQWKAEQSAQLEVYKANVSAELKRQSQMPRETEGGEGGEAGMGSFKSDQGLSAVGMGLQAIAQAMSRPKQIVLGPDGLPTGIE